MSKHITFRLVEGNREGYRNLTVPEDITWGDFLHEVRDVLHSDAMKIKYVDSDEDEVCIDTAEELEEAIRWMSKKEDSEEECLSESSRSGSDVKRPKDESDLNPSMLGCDDADGLDREDRVVPRDNSALLASVTEGHGDGEPAAGSRIAPPWFREAIEQLKDELLGQLWAERDRPPEVRYGPLSHVVHTGVRCDFCGTAVVGARYKCGTCPDYDLCEACEVMADEIHPLDHAFVKLRRSTTVAGRTRGGGRLVPLLIGSPYEELYDDCAPPPASASGSSRTDDPAAATRSSSSSSSRMCKMSGAGLERRLRKLEKIESKMARNGQQQDELRREEKRLQEKLDRVAAAAAASAGGFVCSDSATAKAFPEATSAACTSGDELTPDLQRLCRKLDKVRRQIGKMMKQHEKLCEKKSGFTRCLSSDCLAEESSAPAAAAAATDARKQGKRCSRSGVRKEGFKATFVGDETVPDGSKLAGGTKFVKRWRLRNDGATRWDQRITLQQLWGNIPSGSSEVALPPLAPGEQGVVSVEFEAPLEEGQYRSSWRPCRAGKKFGSEFWCSIKVIPRMPSFGQQRLDGHGTRSEIERGDPTESAAGAAQHCGSAAGTDGSAGRLEAPVGGVAATVAAESPAAGQDPRGDPLQRAPPAFDRGQDDDEEEEEAAAAAAEGERGRAVAASSSLETVCHYVHLKMTATSQTATPNNTPLVMSPPKSPEPSAVIRGCTCAASATRRQHSGDGEGSGDGVARSLGREWELAMAASSAAGECAAHKPDLVGETDPQEDGCYDDEDDFCVVSVPACFNLEVPYAPASEPAAVRAGAATSLPADATNTDGVAASAGLLPPMPSSSPADLADRFDGYGGGLGSLRPIIVAAPAHLGSTCANRASAASSAEPQRQAVPGPSNELTIVQIGVISDALLPAAVPSDRAAAAAADPSAETRCVASRDPRGGDDKVAAAAPCAASAADVAAIRGATPAARPESFDEEAERERAGEAGASQQQRSAPSFELRQKLHLGIAEYLFSKMRGAVNLLSLTDEEENASAAAVSNVTMSEGDNDQVLTARVDQLVAMGFANRPLNRELLQKHNGDMGAVLRVLLDEHDNEWYSRRH